MSKSPSDVPQLRLSRLLEMHPRLDELFSRHQELVLQGELRAAGQVLDLHREFFELHVSHEEELLLPIYASANPSPRWPCRLYTGQHRRMRELLIGARRRLHAISGSGSVRRQGMLALLDHETTYKHLSEHHDGAERAGFFPLLEIAATPLEHAEITRLCLAEWVRLESRAVVTLAVSNPEALSV